MLLVLAAAFVALLIVGLLYGFAAIRWLAAAFIIAVAIGLGPAIWMTLDPIDRCLDSGGRWNEAADFCEP